MPAAKSSFFDKVLGRLGRLDDKVLRSVVGRLAQERSFLQTLFHTIEDGVVVVNTTGKIVFFNEAVTRLLGFDREKSEGQPINQFLPELDWQHLLKMDLEGGAKVQRHELEVSFPRPRFLSLYVSPLDGAAAGSSGLVLILHDVTEARKQTFEAIESERVKALTLLAASVAHEIGNPLNALSIHLQLMERELHKLREMADAAGSRSSVTSGQRSSQMEVIDRLSQYLNVAQGEITRLDYIVTQFLQALRPVKPQLRLTQLNEVVRDAVALLRPEITNRGICLVEKLSSRAPTIPIDPGQIKQVLVNLIKNAMQAMTKGGVLTLRTSTATEGVLLSVEDTGGGIPTEQLNRIFEPFYTTKKKGSGLGLMIVQRIVSDHDGRIELESHVGKGTSFRIWLPLHERPPRLLEAPK
ncbi:MAG: PAS domain S-box protein [Verrucomicrobiales bacterium]|nr:PAS domain S-box protein [Verrucomicrobiales bacterium]